jgi:hypothetical protein
MFLPLLAPVLEAAAAKAVKPVVLVLLEGAIFVLVGSVARPKEELLQQVLTMAAYGGCGRRGCKDKKVVSIGKMTEYRASQPQNCNFNLD